MPSHLADYQQVLEQIVTRIINHLTQYQKNYPLVPAWKKADGSFVTPADYGIQYLLRTQLSEAFSSIPFIGEETLDPDLDLHKAPKILEFVHQFAPETTIDDLLTILSPTETTSSLFWLVDPIDGTAGFIKKKFYAVAVSLIYETRPVLSVVAMPAANHTFKVYSAAKGCGLSVFGSAVPSRQALQSGKIQTGRFCEASLAARNQQHFATRQLSLRLPGSPQAYRIDSQCKYALVAENSVDFFIRFPFTASQAHCRDHAPGAFLVEEAGGIVSDVHGNPLRYNCKDFVLDNHPIIIASGNQETHDRILDILQAQEIAVQI